MKAARVLGLLLISFAAVTPALSEAMHFEARDTGGNNCRDRRCWIQATGEIVPSTPTDFEQFITQPNKFVPSIIRLHSPGGNLVAGLQLGQKIRKHGFYTEIGSTLWDPKKEPLDRGASERKPGFCASACAYAFLGGVDRAVDEGSRFGVHRFYTSTSVKEPTARQFTGEDLDETQKLMAGLTLYVMQMGVNPTLIALAATTGADEMRWLTLTEARELRVSYAPETWKPWWLEAYRGGAIAISETYDGKIRLVASCTKRFGPQVVLTDFIQPDEAWFQQNRTCSTIGRHPVFGTLVDPSRISAFKLKDGGAAIRFQLPTNNPQLKSPAIFETSFDPMIYPMACSTDRYRGTTENFEAAVRLAFRNCFQD